MPPAQRILSERKRPRQDRAVHTVVQIFEATIQVLLREGASRLTTIRVAERAGVSIGTLYQYFPNKHALLAAVVERHVTGVVERVEAACQASMGRSLEVMVRLVCEAYFSAKFERADVSRALLLVSAELERDSLITRLQHRAQLALCNTLASLNDVRISDVRMASFLIATIPSGPVHALLMEGAAPDQVITTRDQLVVVLVAYLRALAG